MALVKKGAVFCLNMAALGKVIRCWNQISKVFQRPHNVEPILCTVPQEQTSIRYNSNYCAMHRIRRKVYVQMYPTMILQPDGSTINIRYEIPRKIIKFPLDLTTLTEEERIQRLKRRRPKQVLKVYDDIEDSFSQNQYKHLWKKKK